MASTDGWFYVDASTGQPVGPYDMRALQGLISNGMIRAETPLWKEGREAWLKLAEIDELEPLVMVAAEVAKSAMRKGTTGPAPDDELAAFKAEIQALEATGTEEGDEGTGEGATEGEGPSTPEELEFEDDDGTMYVWDKKLRKYMPKAGASTGPGSEAGYDVEAMTFSVEEEVIPTLAAAKAAEEGTDAAVVERKRKAEEAGPSGKGAAVGGNGKEQGGKGGKKQKGQAQQPQQPAQWFELKNNTSVYVSGFPKDVTIEEIVAAFSKYGLIKEDDNRQPRIKLYRNKDSGALKGDGLVTYLKEPSVALAVQLLDGTPLRPGGSPNMTVQPAKFEMKGEAYKPKETKPKNKKATKAVLERQERLLGWGGMDDKLPAEKVTVIVRNMFSPLELAGELGAAEELEKEVTEEAGSLGPVEKVRVYKDHPEGIVSIRYKTAEAAQACLQRMQGRFFGGRQLAAAMWDGITNYALVKAKESEEEQAARLEAYARELEALAKAKAARAEGAAAAPAAEGEEAAAGGGDVAMS